MEEPLFARMTRTYDTAIAPLAAGVTTRDVIPLLLALAIAACFAGILLGAIDFPLETHGDELSKVTAVLKHRNNYNHPLLMLHLARGVNSIAGLTDAQAVVELGRTLAVLSGALAVFATYLLAREALPGPATLAAAAATAVTPLVVVHARFFKEDIFVLPLILFSLLALIETMKAPTRGRSLLLGLATGLAASAKYVGIMLVPFAVVVLLVKLSGVTTLRQRLLLAAIIVAAAGAVLVVVQSPAFWELKRYASSVAGNMRLAESGKGPRLPLALTHGLFHLRESLLPGLGAPLLVLGLLGFSTVFLAAPEQRRPVLVIAGFAMLWVLVHECSPFKPYPNFQRYMVPAAPLLVILGTVFVYELARRCSPAPSGAIAALAILVAALPALQTTVRIAGAPEEDLRRIVPPIVLSETPNAVFDRYTSFTHKGGLPEHVGPSTLMVTSNFVYDRYRDAGASDLQRDEIRDRTARYADLFGRPYLEVSNGRPSFAFFNPVLRILALDGDSARLQRLAASLRAKYPDLKLTLVKGPRSWQ